MARAQEIDEVSPGIFVWQAYDSKVKAELFSTALETKTGLYLVDPVPLAPHPAGLLANRNAAGIFVTNVNHGRAAGEFSEALSVPVYANQELRGTADFPEAAWVQDGEALSPGLAVIAIDGGPAGESALHHADNGGTIVVGDALINFEPLGFALLPAKYCLDQKLMRRSLSKLLDFTFERMLFAHGTPILSGARARVENLLATAG
jgi:Metallo-beta-lactamase superfamily